MKALAKIGIQLTIMLLALSNLAFQQSTTSSQQPGKTKLNAATFSTYSNPLLCLPKQNTGLYSSQIGSSLPKKFLALFVSTPSVEQNSSIISNRHYFSATQFMLTALEVSVIIFPFHYFW